MALRVQFAELTDFLKPVFNIPKMKHFLALIAVFTAALMMDPSSTVLAQSGGTNGVVPAPEARQSPIALAASTVDGAYVKVVYGSPRMRGRSIFGGLVPNGAVWRTGANEATEITFSRPVLFAGQRVEPGTYALFSIPERDQWTVILNNGLGQWGSYEYDESLDVVRVDVTPERSAQQHEAFTIRFDDDEGRGGTTLLLLWDETRVPIRVEAAN